MILGRDVTGFTERFNPRLDISFRNSISEDGSNFSSKILQTLVFWVLKILVQKGSYFGMGPIDDPFGHNSVQS